MNRLLQKHLRMKGHKENLSCIISPFPMDISGSRHNRETVDDNYDISVTFKPEWTYTSSNVGFVR